MVDITIHRCTLRIVRHGGWGWGPEPRRLLQTAIKALPELLEAELGKLWPDDLELNFAAPVSLRIPMRLGELVAAAHREEGFNSTTTSPEAQALGQRIAVAARRAFGSEQSASVSQAEIARPAKDERAIALPLQRGPGSAVFEVLRSWCEAGVLTQRLSGFSVTALAAWLAQLSQPAPGPIAQTPDGPVACESVGRAARGRIGETSYPVTSFVTQPRSGHGDSVPIEVIIRVVADHVRLLQDAAEDRAAALRRRLIILIEVMTELGLRQCDPPLLETLERLLPLPGAANVPASEALTSPKFTQDEYSLPGAANVPASEALTSPKFTQDEYGLPGAAHVPASEAEETRSGGSSEQRTSTPGRVATTVRESERDRSNFSRAVSQPAVGADHSETRSTQASLVAAERASEQSQRSSQANVPALALQPAVAVTLLPGVRRLAADGSKQRVVSALPFILLGPLSRVGYLKVLAATLEAADAVASSSLFAAALAYKVLAPPARGWRREPDAITAASAFAGLAQPVPEPELAQLARHLDQQLSPLDALISGALISGHNQQKPILLLRAGTKTEDGFLLVDVEGTFAIQWAEELAELRQVLVQLDSSLVLVPQATADAKVLRWLAEEGFQFVTDAIPIRGEQWRSLRCQQERWWTNEAIRSDTSLIKMARLMRTAAEEAASSWAALVVQRPSVPLADDHKLDRHLTLAASLALGTVAWELWRVREQTSPQLALERFSDLGALVTWNRDAVHVTLPLGKRFQDLRDHGLLDDVSEVPWFNGRRLTFSTD
ncbi:MAG: hypothetical protein QOD33_253 [Pyrinomonadaceae bacterium]|jgi:hypothetical protein|nr:hypothetical protein [Pyrinomonadaceae bacterium]